MPGRYTDELRRITRAQSKMPAPADETKSEPKGEAGGRYGPLLALGVVLVLTGLGWLVARQMMADAKLQDCVMSGRKNCIEPVMSAGR
jgi:hypothetical protein